MHEKSSIIDVWQGPKHASVIFTKLCFPIIQTKMCFLLIIIFFSFVSSQQTSYPIGICDYKFSKIPVVEAVTRRCSVKKLFCNIHRKTSLRPAILLKKKLWHRYFPVNYASLLNTFFKRALRVTASAFSTFNLCDLLFTSNAPL